jgi:dTDP-glucose pyrophosphorylase
VYDVFKRESPDYILVANMVDDPYRGAAVYCEGNYCLDIIEKPQKGASSTNLNNTGVFVLARDFFEILKVQSLSKRGEIEVPQAVRSGLKNKNWRIRLIKMEKHQFFADFGNIEDYERYKNNDNLLSKL